MQEETLDPTDWEGFTETAHRLLDIALTHVRDIRQQPVWRGVPDAVKNNLRQAPPEEGESIYSVYEDFLGSILPYVYANIHPRAWGWVIGTGTAQGVLHEMLTASLNCNVFGAEQSPVYVETQVLDWFKQKFNYPSEASGVLVSGASMANLMGLAIARTAVTGETSLRQGLKALSKPLTVYCSSQAHNSIAKAVALLGIGTDQLRAIAVDGNFQMSIPHLSSRIAADRRDGCLPLCIVATAGTTNTGAIDKLEELVVLSERERIWLHVDGAFGALLKLSPSLSSMVSGLEKADSIAFDLHKWLHIPHGAACMLTRHPIQHKATFSSAASYLERHSRGIGSGGILFSDFGIETSRPFRALKIWLALKEHGFKKYARLIEKNVAQARQLAGEISQRKQLRLLSASLNIVCFQFAPVNVEEEKISELNRELLFRLHETGVAGPSYTEIDGQFTIRVCIANHRTTTADLDVLLEEIERIGSELTKEIS